MQVIKTAPAKSWERDRCVQSILARHYPLTLSDLVLRYRAARESIRLTPRVIGGAG